MPTITIKAPNDPSQRFEVSPNRKTITLGRSSKSDVKISCASISGNHATIRKLDEGYVLRDLGSTNGTKLDGTKVSEIHIKGGQNIKLGDVIFTFKPDPDSESSGSREELPPITTKAKSKPKPKIKPKPRQEIEPQTENDSLVWGLALMGGGLIVVGCIVLIGVDAIKAIPERGEGFIAGGISTIVVGLLCLGSILLVTGRIKLPKLAIQFDEDDDEEDEPRPKRKKDKKKKNREESMDGKDSDTEDGDDSDEVLGKAPIDT